jgi:polysaccharide export outer membrane protein
MAPVPRAWSHRESSRIRSPSRFVARRARTGGLAWALPALCIGCAGLPPLPAYPQPARAAAPLGLADDKPPDGALRPGDELVVESGSGEQRRQVRARVNATGELHVDSGRDVPVAGLSLDLAEERVTQVLRESDKLAEIDLLLANRPSQRVTALGALARPGPIEARPRMRIADVIAAAGGILMQADAGGMPALEVADLDRAAVVRNGTALPIDMRAALRAKPGHNVYVHPGDLIYIPFATFNTVSVLGQVNAPRMLPHHAGLRLTEALAAAGGLTTGGDKGDIRLVRGPVESPRVFQASLADIADGEENDAALAPGDVVFVQDHLFEDTAEVFDLAAPLSALLLLGVGIAILSSQ